MRTVAVFTGNRSEYGLQFPLLRAIAAHPALRYRLLVGRDHLYQETGNTVGEIENDGFTIHHRIRLSRPGNDLLSCTCSIGEGVIAISRVLAECRPDFALVYGDRYEAFAAVIASTQMNIATAHVEGGDYTEGGALDDSVRHAMTKLAHLHFTTNAGATGRVLRLGEEPWRVCEIGLPSLDLIAARDFPAPEEIAAELQLDRHRPVILFCQHPVAAEAGQARAQIDASLAAVREMLQAGWQAILTQPNADAGSQDITTALEAMDAERLPGLRMVPHLGRRRFHGVLNLIAAGGGAVVGNSSAGIKETPVFGCPVVNIGTRQQGRLRGDNVIDVDYDPVRIAEAIARCVRDESWIRRCRNSRNPYGTGGAGARLASVLAAIPLDARLLRKKHSFAACVSDGGNRSAAARE